jgi:alkaline phosphatase
MPSKLKIKFKWIYTPFLALLIFSLSITSCASPTPTIDPTPTIEATPNPPTEIVVPTATTIQLPDSLVTSRARNVILMIGDGMGENHRKAATWASLGQDGVLVMDSLPVRGVMTTLNVYGQVTDSAAAATAFSTGLKTSNQRIGADPSGEPLTTILEQAQDLGMSVGLVTTVDLSHATPAAFAAHVRNRHSMEEISSQLVEAGVDILFGGGEMYLIPESETGCFPGSGSRDDGRNIIDEAVASGYVSVCNADDLFFLDEDGRKILGIFGEEEMTRPFTPTLAEMTAFSIDALSQNPEGFFLMIEGGQIDYASHGWDADNAIGDTIAFDQAVQVALEFAETDGETLLIVTADHETGGMIIEEVPGGPTGDRSEFSMPDGSAFKIRWSTSSHTDSEIPTTAMGPGSELLTGTFENTFIYHVMRLSLWIDKSKATD